MAESPAHRFGQFLGNFLEKLILPELESFCAEHKLYLDKHGVRPVRKGKKASWIDAYGNSHDLDFVIEVGGTGDVQGRPLAFIEAAWRRYTKHSRNKAQEIQGAVLPLAEKYEWDRPFKGAILAGNFTGGSLTQLGSLGFEIVYLEYDSLVSDFGKMGIDIAFGEDTPTTWFENVLAELDLGGPSLEEKLIKEVRKSNRDQFDIFFGKLKAKLTRYIEQLTIIPLFGDEHIFTAVGDALKFMSSYISKGGGGSFRGFEVIVKYSNGDRLDGVFTETIEAEKFLKYIGS